MTVRVGRARRAVAAVVAAGLLSLVGACGQSPATNQAKLTGSVVDPPLPRPTQTLLDDRGRPVSLADRPAGELSVLVFGYTHCPDFCPTTAADLAAARAMLPLDQRRHVQVLFVTEDPQRDTPSVLRRWLHSFDDSYIGLIGGNEASRAMLEELYSSLTTRVDDPETPIQHPGTTDEHDDHGHYGIEHTSIVYAFAPGGESVIYTGGATATAYARDFRSLLD